jgi:hypothetical protein
MSITLGLNDFAKVVATTRAVGFSGIGWLDTAYFRTVERDMLLVTVGNRHVQHFIEFYCYGVHVELGDEVIGIPFDVLSTTDREIRSKGLRREDAIVFIGWDDPDERIKGYVEIDSAQSGKVGTQRFEIVKPESDVLDICAPHFYAEDATRFRIEDAQTLSKRIKTAARLFHRDDDKRCEIAWSSASVVNVSLLRTYEWQAVINARITGEDYSTVVEQFSPVTFNPELLAPVLGIGDRVVVALKKDVKGCTFTAGYHTALLMPIRPDSY